MELALNVIYPFEYDDNISAYEGIHRAKFDFKRHPIAPLGCKVLTWDTPWNRRHVYRPGIKPFSLVQHMGPKYLSITHRQHDVVVYGANQTKPGISSI